MRKMGDRQTGFSIIEVVLVVVAVGIVGVAGWFVYQHNRVKVTDAATGNQATNQTQQTGTTTPPANQNVVKIPELGIQITVPDSIKDLTYQTQTVTLRNGNQAILAKFSTASLTSANPHCGPSSMVLGSLEKATGQYPTQSQDDTNVLDYGQLIKQFPAFYISGSFAHAGVCPAGTTTPTAASSNAHDLSSALSTMQSLN